MATPWHDTCYGEGLKVQTDFSVEVYLALQQCDGLCCLVAWPQAYEQSVGIAPVPHPARLRSATSVSSLLWE